MEGVTTAILLFVFVCIVFPKLIQNKTQYYAAVFCVVGIILLDAVSQAISLSEHASLRVFLYFGVALLQIIAVVSLFLGCGGASLSDLAGEMNNAIEVIRRGGEQKEVIIPLSGEMARLKAQREAEKEAAAADRIVINSPPPPQPPPSAPPKDLGPLPLD